MTTGWISTLPIRLARLVRVAFLTLPAAIITAADLQAQNPRPGGITSKVDALFAQFASVDSPGCVVGIIENGRFIYRSAYGMANLEEAIPLTTATTVYGASLVKQFFAASVLVASTQGHLSLDDDIRTHVPEMPVYGRPITVRQLIDHTSGLRDIYMLAWLSKWEWRDPDRNEALELLTRQQSLNFVPGTDWQYTTSNYEMLGHVLERATGMRLAEYMEANLFRPLGMMDTRLHEGTHYGAIGYEGDNGEAHRRAEVGHRRGAYTSLDDLLRWERGLEAATLLDPTLVEQLYTPAVLEGGAVVPYAFGIHVGEYRGLRTIAHGGGFPGFRAGYLRFPDERFSVVCLCNTTNVWPAGLAHQIASLYLEDRFSEIPPPVDLPLEVLEDLTGTYLSPTGSILDVIIADSALAFSSDRTTNPLVPIGPWRFRSPLFGNNEYQFHREAPGDPWQFVVHPAVAGTEQRRAFMFRAVAIVSPGPDDLDDYEGWYESDEVAATYRIVLDGTTLRLVYDPDSPGVALRPTARDTFTAEGFSVALRFLRDHDGRVLGFGFQSGGIWDLRFTRSGS